MRCPKCGDEDKTVTIEQFHVFACYACNYASTDWQKARIAELEAELRETNQKLIDELAKNALTPTGMARLEELEARLAIAVDALKAIKGGKSCHLCKEAYKKGAILLTEESTGMRHNCDAAIASEALEKIEKGEKR